MQHAKNYATLLNTSVGTKEMVHRIFKNIILRTNRKNVDLDLLKRYTTLFAIRHLLDGGIDNRFSSTNNALTTISYHLRRLMNDWFIAEKTFDEPGDENISEGLVFINTYILTFVFCLILSLSKTFAYIIISSITS